VLVSLFAYFIYIVTAFTAIMGLLVVAFNGSTLDEHCITRARSLTIRSRRRICSVRCSWLRRKTRRLRKILRQAMPKLRTPLRRQMRTPKRPSANGRRVRTNSRLGARILPAATIRSRRVIAEGSDTGPGLTRSAKNSTRYIREPHSQPISGGEAVVVKTIGGDYRVTICLGSVLGP